MQPPSICLMPVVHVVLSLLLTACSTLPDSGGWGRSGDQRAPVESRDGRSGPQVTAEEATRLAQGEAAIALTLARLKARPEHILQPEQTGYYMDVQLATLRKRFAGVDVTLSREDGQLRLVLPESATFTSGSAELTGNARGMLEGVAQVLAEYDKTLVVVEGHSDALGPAGFNQTLSEQRALAVAHSLLAHGVSARRLVAVGYGADRPVASNDTDADRARNRRVELLVRPVTAT